MKTREAKVFRPVVGQSIDSAAEAMVALADEHGCEVVASFNDIDVVAHPGDSPGAIAVAYVYEMWRQAAAYRESPEGKRVAAEREAERAAMQIQADKIMDEMQAVDFDSPSAVIDWLVRLQPASERVGVTIDAVAVLDALEAHGFATNANCGEAHDSNDPENVARWIIGQAMDGLDKVGAIHPLVVHFADKWRAQNGLMARA